MAATEATHVAAAEPAHMPATTHVATTAVTATAMTATAMTATAAMGERNTARAEKRQ